MDESEARTTFEKEGFTQLYVHADGPGFEYPEHDHPVYTAHIILKGSMTVTEGGKTHHLKVRDRLDFPKGVAHGVVMGSEGCTYITGIRV
jgi:quercetin dioxygenase-like cupin family protein